MLTTSTGPTPDHHAASPAPRRLLLGSPRAAALLAALVLAAVGAATAAADSQIQDKGSYWRLWSPPEPTTKRYEYFCDIPKRIVETTNRAVRSKLLQIPCKLHQGGIPAGAVVEMYAAGSSTATNGSSGNWDYNFYHSKLKMYPGDKGTQRLQFRIHDDQSAEGAEYFQFALKWSTKVGYPPFWWTLNESVHTLTVYIDDDDEYDLSVSPGQVWEEAGDQDHHRDRSDEERSEPRRGPHAQHPGRRRHGHRHRGHRLPDRQQLRPDHPQGEQGAAPAPSP